LNLITVTEVEHAFEFFFWLDINWVELNQIEITSTAMAAERILSFAEIVKGRESGVRVTDDNMLFAVDLAVVVTGKDRDHAGQALRGLSDEIFPSLKFSERKFPGKGNAHTKLVSFDDAIELIMVLPGKVARETRMKFRDIIKRYLAGDDTLIADIEANAKSDSPIAQMARASLAAEAAPAQNEIGLPYKRKLEELEVARLEVEIQAKKAAIRDSEREHIIRCSESYNEMCQDTVMDERARLIFKDCFLNMAMLHGPSRALLTNGDEPSPNKPISLSMVATQLGLKIQPNELISIGMELKKKYVEKHGKEPTKHDQLCGGRMTKVNSYMESDRDIMEAVLRAHAK
jgi:hypothetical protein